MGSTPPDAVDLVLRYLAGRLPPAEAEALERTLSEHPELREQTEQLLKLKEGLARLRDRGELDALLRAPARSRWLPYAAAATVAIISLAALAWLYLPRTPANLLALSPAQFASGERAAPPVVGSYVLARMRGGTSATELPRAGLAELRVLPSAQSATATYRAEVIASNSTGSGRTVGQLEAGRASGDGYVTLYVECTKLPPGDYELVLSPATAVAAEPYADRFPLRVR